MGEIMEPSQYHLIATNERHHWWYRVVFATLRQTARRYVHAGSLILDAGCGTGALIRRLSNRYNPIGIDPSPLALTYAQREQRPLAAATIEALPLADASVNAATCIDVIYHRLVVSDEVAVAELARVLKPGGVLVLQVPALSWLRSRHDDAVHGARRYSRRELIRLATAAGLRPLCCRYRLSFLAPLILADNFVRRMRGAAADEEAISPPKPWLNWLLEKLGYAELALGLPAPFGSSLLLVARKPH